MKINMEDFIITEWRNRMRFMADIVFATSMTIMILNLEIPGVAEIDNAKEFTDFMIKQLSGMAAFFISFMTVSVYWMKHLEHFSITTKVNQTYMIYQLLFLAMIMLVPFWSTYVGQSQDSLSIKLFFSMNMVLIGLFSYISMHYAEKHKFIHQQVTEEEIKTSKRQILAEPAIAILASVFALFNPSYWDIAFIMIPILFASRKKLVKSKYIKFIKDKISK